MKTHTLCFALAWLCLWWGGAALVSRATANEDSLSGRCHIIVNNDALDLIRKGQEAQKTQNWTRALKNYQTALERYGNYVLPANENNSYIGVKYFCETLLAQLPTKGREVYRQLFDPVASTLFEKAIRTGDSEPFYQIIDHYLYTSYGDDALYWLANLYLEKGAWGKAVRLLEILAELDSDISHALILAQEATCYARLDQRDDLQELLIVVKKKYPKTTIVINHKTQSLLDFVRRLQAALPRKDSQQSWQPDWTTYGGNNSHTELMGPEIQKLPPKAWSFRIPSLAEQNLSQSHLTIVKGSLVPGRPMPRINYLPYFPCIYNGMVYLTTDTAVYVFNLIPVKKANEPGLPADQPELLWKFENPDIKKLLFEERTVHSATVYQNKIYVNIVSSIRGGEKYTYFYVKFPIPNRSLLALDSDGGRILWRVGGYEESSKFLEKASFTMPPLIEHNVLYTAGIYVEYSTDLPEHYLCAFDINTGRLKWKTFIVSGLLEVNLFNNPSRESFSSSVTIDNRNVYYCSNVGVITAVDKFNGTINWLTEYKQYEIPPTRGATPHRLPLNWVNNPLIYWESADRQHKALIVTPIDSPYLYAVNPDNGKIIWQWDSSKLGGIRYLLGVANDFLYVSGAKGVMCFSLMKEGKRVWAYPKALRGKGCLTPKAVYLSTATDLIRLNTRSGKIETSWKWADPTAEAGHIFLLDNILMTLTSDRLNVFYDFEDLGSWFVRQLKERPDDPYLLYRVGESYLKTKDYQAAIKLFKKALQSVTDDPPDKGALKTGGQDHTRRQLVANLKRLLYQTYIHMVQRTLGHETSQADITPTLLWLKSAREYALDSTSFIEATQQMIGLYSMQKRWSEVVGEYQEIMRHFPESLYKGQTGWDLARLEIDRLIKKHGRTIYQKEETKVQRLASEGLDDEEIFRLYPNSYLVQERTFKGLRESFQAKEHYETIKKARRFLKYFSDSSKLFTAYTTLLESCEALKMHGQSRSILNRMVKDFPVRSQEYVKTRLGRKEYQKVISFTNLTELLMPPLQNVWTYSEKESAIVRLVYDKKYLGSNYLFAMTKDKITALDKSDGNIQWQKRTGLDLLPNLFYAEGSIILLTRQEVLALKEPSGNVKWRYPVKNGSAHLVKSASLQEQLFILLRDSVNPTKTILVALDITQGNKLWHYIFEGHPADYILVTDEVICLATRNAIIILDRDTGKRTRFIQLPNKLNELLYLETASALPGRICALIQNKQLILYNLLTGQAVWKYLSKDMIIPKTLQFNGKSIVFITAPKDKKSGLEITVLDSSSGRPRRPKNKLINVSLKKLKIDKTQIYSIVENIANRNLLRITAYDIKTAEMNWSHVIKLDKLTALSEINFTPSYIILNCSYFNLEKKKWEPVIYIVDKILGKEIQKIEGKLKSTGQPELICFDRFLFVIQDNVIHAYSR